jgi:hypothetical protein
MIDLVKDREDFYRQTNNDLDAGIACQCTTVTAGLDVTHNHDVSPLLALGSYKQPEDNLRYFTGHDPDVLAFCRRSHPGSKIPPAEWADVLVYAVNKIYGRKVVYFEPKLTPQVMLSDLAKSLPVMASLRFPEHRIDGHYILVVGETEGKWIINDPYKNLLTGSPDGFHCIYTPEDWAAHTKGYGIRFIRAA